MRFDLGTLDSGELSLPFGLLVFISGQFIEEVIHSKTRQLIQNPLSHWAVTVGDKLWTAFAREFPKCLETFAGVLNVLVWVSVIRLRLWNLQFLGTFKTFAKQTLSQNSHRVVAGVSNPSRILLNLVSVSQKVREMWDKFVRDGQPMKLNYDWLETKMRIWHSGHECHTTITRVSCDIRATCMRTAGELWQYLQQYLCDIRRCVEKYRFSVIPNEYGS